MGYDPVGGASRSAIVEACVSAYSQTIAMCPGDHWKLNRKGGRDRQKTNTSSLARILRQPNAYQTISDFMLNATRSLYLEGNTYALALRNDRFEVSELHLMTSRDCAPIVAETGDVFYRLGGNDVIAKELGAEQLIVPQRDVLHIRLHTDRRYPFPLVGETPLVAALQDMGVGDAIANQQIQFYMNMARPSAVLSTELALDKDQVQALRDRWDEQTKGMNQGKVPILTAGLKVQPWTTPPKDAQIADVMKFSEQHIALAFRVPLQILGIGGSPYSSTESLMQTWIATGLGFALNHIEEAFGKLFQLRGVPDEYVEFDTAALLRSAFKDRIDGLTKAVQGGIFSPNEAREQEGLDKVEFGDEPRVQQQVVPLSAAAKIPAPSSKLPGEIPPAPPAPPSPPAPKDHRHDVQRHIRAVVNAAERVKRRYS
jgi:HK97 family phage portal protein